MSTFYSKFSFIFVDFYFNFNYVSYLSTYDNQNGRLCMKTLRKLHAQKPVEF